MHNQNMKRFFAAIEALDLQSIGFKWQRDVHDKQKYRLNHTSGCDVGCVWRTGSQWWSLDGRDFYLLKLAKASVEENYKQHLFTLVEQFNSRLECSTSTPQRFSVTNISASDIQSFQSLMNTVLTESIGSMVEGYPGLIRRPQKDRFGDSLVTMDYSGHIIMLQPYAIASNSVGDTVQIDLSKLIVSLLICDNTGKTPLPVKCIGNNGVLQYQVTSLTDSGMINLSASLFESVVGHLYLLNIAV